MRNDFYIIKPFESLAAAEGFLFWLSSADDCSLGANNLERRVPRQNPLFSQPVLCRILFGRLTEIERAAILFPFFYSTHSNVIIYPVSRPFFLTSITDEALAYTIAR